MGELDANPSTDFCQQNTAAAQPAKFVLHLMLFFQRALLHKAAFHP
jgi:hypothetical protein